MGGGRRVCIGRRIGRMRLFRGSTEEGSWGVGVGVRQGHICDFDRGLTDAAGGLA